MIILAIDPSGEHNSEKAGNGTTGFALRTPELLTTFDERAEKYETTEEYWEAVLHHIITEQPDYVVVEGYRLYNHRGMSASTQANSTLMTPQLIGCIRLTCKQLEIPLHTQFASEVKTRWTDAILAKKLYLTSGRGNVHQRDSLRHLAHFETYKLKELTK